MIKPTLLLLALLTAASSPLSARAMPNLTTKAVSYQDGEVKLEGFLAYDEAQGGSGLRPGVIVVPEWWGVNEYAKSRAEQLARLGYVAFVVDMYGVGKTTTDAKQAGAWAGEFYGKPLMASRARAGLDQLLATKLVDESKVAAIGYCFGGSTVLALAFSGAPLAAVVTFHGGLSPVPAGAAAVTKAKFLICHGAIDPTVKPEARDAFIKGMDEAKFDYQFISYSGAVHAFSNPDADRMAQKNGLVGMIGYNAEADRRSFAAMQSFFAEVLR
jgi:dienelactone hydrolase